MQNLSVQNLHSLIDYKIAKLYFIVENDINFYCTIFFSYSYKILASVFFFFEIVNSLVVILKCFVDTHAALLNN